jgi:hypothetical protein
MAPVVVRDPELDLLRGEIMSRHARQEERSNRDAENDNPARNCVSLVRPEVLVRPK